MLAHRHFDQSVKGEQVADRIVGDTTEIDDDFGMWCRPTSVIGRIKARSRCVRDRGPQRLGQCRWPARIRIRPAWESPIQPSRLLPRMYTRCKRPIVQIIKIFPDNVDPGLESGIPEGITTRCDQFLWNRVL